MFNQTVKTKKITLNMLFNKNKILECNKELLNRENYWLAIKKYCQKFI